jgi:hypothetical protein
VNRDYEEPSPLRRYLHIQRKTSGKHVFLKGTILTFFLKKGNTGGNDWKTRVNAHNGKMGRRARKNA